MTASNNQARLSIAERLHLNLTFANLAAAKIFSDRENYKERLVKKGDCPHDGG